MSPFAIGDVVRLKSGGPHMIVTRCDDAGVQCMWAIPGERFPVRNVFPSDDLVFVLAATGGAA